MFVCVPGLHTSMAHSDMNTEAKTIKTQGMNHTEGGWPEHVRTEMVEHKNKFIRCGDIWHKLMENICINDIILQTDLQRGHVQVDCDRSDQEDGDSSEAE